MNEAERSPDKRTSVQPPRTRWLLLGLAIVLIGGAAIGILLYRSGSLRPNSTSHHHPNDANPGSSQPDAQSAALAVINRTPAPGPAPDGMVWIPGGTFWMGCDDCEMPDTQPVHLVSVDGFWMDRTPVTNARFAEFVKATGYLTAAERKPDPKDYPGVDPSKLVAGSAVFTPPAQNVSLDDVSEW